MRLSLLGVLSPFLGFQLSILNPLSKCSAQKSNGSSVYAGKLKLVVSVPALKG